MKEAELSSVRVPPGLLLLTWLRKRMKMFFQAVKISDILPMPLSECTNPALCALAKHELVFFKGGLAASGRKTVA